VVAGDEVPNPRVEMGRQSTDYVVATDVSVEDVDLLAADQSGQPPGRWQIDGVAEREFVESYRPAG
jgi:nucleoside phosphorylase